MQIDTEHLHYWMQAIRTSDDPQRILDAFWAGQIKSKEWLISNLKPWMTFGSVDIDIHGGWVGVLASMLFQSRISIDKIRSIDIDPTCLTTALTMNKGEEIQGKFTALTADMCDIWSDYAVIINTSCEHISQEQYDRWLEKQGQHSIIVVQSNNYDIPEHIHLANSLDEFKQQSQLEVLWAGELSLPLYTRYMIIGKKHE
jgi:hypothetical protein